MKKTAFFAATIFVLPLISFADTVGPNPRLNSIVSIFLTIRDIVNLLIPILMGAAVVAFFYGLVMYIWGSGGEGKASGKNIMIAGLTSLFIMASLWGIISLAQGVLGVTDTGDNSLPAPHIK